MTKFHTTTTTSDRSEKSVSFKKTFLTGVSACILSLGLTAVYAPQAYAQDACQLADGTDGEAEASNDETLACGTDAEASGTEATAVGVDFRVIICTGTTACSTRLGAGSKRSPLLIDSATTCPSCCGRVK